MFCTIDGKQYEFYESKLVTTEITGIASVLSGIVSEEDIAHADKNAIFNLQIYPLKLADRLMSLQGEESSGIAGAYTGKTEKILVRSSRTYFELSDSSVSLLPPLGCHASHIECKWMFSWIPKAALKSMDSYIERKEPAVPSLRVCTIAGKQYRIPTELVKKSTSTFMVGVAGDSVTEEDIVRLDSCVNNGFDETIGNADCVEIQRLRLYFKLPDGSISQVPPVGRTDRRIECRSLLQTISRESLDELSPLSAYQRQT